jgi:murein DD-endopeptidase MepM/ murein hydrolase activator NlpD
MFAQTAAPATKSAPSTTASSGSYPLMSTAAKNRARQLFGYLESGQSAQLYAAFSEQMKKSGGGRVQLTTVSKKIGSEWGREVKMLGENFAPDTLAPNTIYSRFSQFAKSKDPIYTILAIDQQGQVALLRFQPAPQPSGNRFVDYKDTTKLRLPFDGDWFVYNGGRDIYQNSNAYREAERYSLMFTFLKDRRPYSGDGSKNEDYYCYGQPVLAPAGGTVVLVNNTFADNVPGRVEEIMPTGNRVLISHGNQEYSLFMHLKQNSIKVKTGQKVKAGQTLGECGNSGNSPAPHFEYRLQNSSGRPLPETVPAQFIDYVADGAPVTIGEPLRGQTVHNASPPPATPAVATAPAAEKK